MLLIKAKGGLGNRMLSAASAIAYAESTNREWCLDWRDGVYAEYQQNAAPFLFPTLGDQWVCQGALSNISAIPDFWRGRLSKSISDVISQDHPGAHSNPLIYRKLSAPFCVANIEVNNRVEVFWSYTSKYGRIQRFLSKEQRRAGRDHVLGHVLRSYFKPSDDVSKAVDEMSLGEIKALGVHIRYTDLKIPIEKLIEDVKRHMRKFSYGAIFLASDSQEAENRFKKEFKKVVTYPKRYAQNNTQLHASYGDNCKTEGAKSALIDMFALSKCAGLVYCSRSTFAETSRLIGEFESSRVVDVDRFNLLVRLKRHAQEYL